MDVVLELIVFKPVLPNPNSFVPEDLQLVSSESIGHIGASYLSAHSPEDRIETTEDPAE